MQYDFNLSANGGSTLDIKGKFFKYKSGTGLLRVRTDKGGYVDLLPGQGVWNVDFSRLMLQDKSGANNAGILLAGDFDFHDDRISGSVEVIDGGKNRTIAGVAFAGGAYCAATAGQFPQIQLYNPAGSGKVLTVSSLMGGSASAIASVAAVLTGAGTSLANLNRKGLSKMAGGAASIADLRYGSAAALPTPSLISIQASANVAVGYKFTEPVLLLPDSGLIMYANGSGADLNGFFEYYESPQ